jgi:hypothetical protein
LLLKTLRASSLFESELARFELWQKATLDGPTAIALVAITLVASLLSGMLPLFTVNTRTSNIRSSRRLRVILLVAQLTITGILSYSGILIARNVRSLLNADRGFRTEQILTAGIGISEAKYNTDEKMIRFHQQAIAQLRSVPGVSDAAGGLSLPLSRSRTRFLIDDELAPREKQRMCGFGVASPELLPLLGIACVRGRMLGAADRWTSPRVALVNQAFVDRYLPAGQDPLAHRLRFSFYNGFATKPYEEHQIVGIVRNTSNRDLAVDTEPQIIISSDQMAFEGFQYLVRSSLPAAALQKDIQEAIWRVDPEVQRVSLKPLVDRVEQSLVSRRLLAWLLNVFGGIAIVLVAFGLASTLSATFLEMTRELSIRSALGAPRISLAIESVRWAIVAIVLSELLIAPISVLLGRVLVLDRAPVGWDGVSWLMASVVVSLIGIVTAIAPARNAASVDPAVILRSE